MLDESLEEASTDTAEPVKPSMPSYPSLARRKKVDPEKERVRLRKISFLIDNYALLSFDVGSAGKCA